MFWNYLRHFLSRNTNFLLKKPPEGDETAYCHPSPRAWTLAASDLDGTGPESPIEFQELLVAGRVGTGAATKFKVWLEHYRHIAPMIDALIHDGDIVLMRHQQQVENGELAAVWLREQEETTLKRFYLEGEQVRLQPANPTMGPMFFPANNVEVMGKVLLVIRQLN